MEATLRDGRREERYQRQALLRQIGREGQRRLGEACVLVLGCGALGTGIANLLARAGVGRIRICDRDFVELTNLHRQVLFTERDAAEGTPKALAAANALRAMNSTIAVEEHVVDVNASNIEALLQGADVAVDGLDNFDTRYLLNDACVKHGLPWVYGSCVGTFGLVMSIRPGVTACLQCAFPEPAPAGSQPTCDTAGVLNAAAQTVAAMEAAEVIKRIVGAEDRALRGLLEIDLWAASYRAYPVSRRPDCACCGEGRFEFLDRGRGARLTSLCGRNAVQVLPEGAAAVDLAALEARLGPLGVVTRSRFLLRAAIADCELAVFADGRAIIKGTDDPAVARTLYDRYVGT